jgi:hypothetical protein
MSVPTLQRQSSPRIRREMTALGLRDRQIHVMGALIVAIAALSIGSAVLSLLAH